LASGASTGLTNEQRATVDDFFSIHSSRRVLFDVLQPRGYWGRLRDLVAWKTNGSSAGDQTHIGDPNGDGMIDLLYGRAEGQDSLTDPPDLGPLVWRARLSTGTAFGDASKWADDAGGEGWIVP
jgi:hypothetical protein